MNVEVMTYDWKVGKQFSVIRKHYVSSFNKLRLVNEEHTIYCSPVNYEDIEGSIELSKLWLNFELQKAIFNKINNF